MVDILLWTFVLWLLFIPAANIINRYKQGKLNGVETFLGKIYIYSFAVVDILYNYSYGTGLFMAFPPKGKHTLTARLKHYLRTEPESWRGEIAYFMCRYMIEPHDPGHCALDGIFED